MGLGFHRWQNKVQNGGEAVIFREGGASVEPEGKWGSWLPRAWPTQCLSLSPAWVQSGGLLQADAGGPTPLQRVLQPTRI